VRPDTHIRTNVIVIPLKDGGTIRLDIRIHTEKLGHNIMIPLWDYVLVPFCVRAENDRLGALDGAFGVRLDALDSWCNGGVIQGSIDCRQNIRF